MKANILKVTASVLAINFIQFASSAALSALCNRSDGQNNTTVVLKIVVQDDWRIASIIPLEPGVVFRIPCEAPTSIAEEFRCSEYFNVFGGMSYTFLRDTQNKMSFAVKTNLDSEPVQTTTFDCAKE